MIAYAAKFQAERDGITVTFPDFPEAITSGSDEAEAVEFAIDALESVIGEYMKRRRALPQARKPGKGMRWITLPALAEAKIRLYETMREQGVRKADLARRLRWQPSQVDRLLDLQHASRLDQIEQALGSLHKQLQVEVRDKVTHAAA